jgi:uncharacterized protein YcaQ
MPITLDDMRRFTVARSLFPPTTLKRALDRMGFVQADPIRAPARAQDLILRHRVKGYCAGDLERRYAKLGVHEDFFVNYGFVTEELQALMHPRGTPRSPRTPWFGIRNKKAQALWEFVRARGIVHPQEVDQHFSHGTVTNYWGGKSNATTHLLDQLHYQGLLRVVKRERGIRLYGIHERESKAIDRAEREERLDTLADAAVNVYAPMPKSSLSFLLRRLRYAAPQWEKYIPRTLQRAQQRLAQENIDGVEWYWPAGEDPKSLKVERTARLLAPFDPVVWDRSRFGILWNWTYRFEAYTPASKRVRGYYALPLLWQDRVIGWGNLSVKNGELKAEFGYIDSSPTADAAFQRELELELQRMRVFLGLRY